MSDTNQDPTMGGGLSSQSNGTNVLHDAPRTQSGSKVSVTQVTVPLFPIVPRTQLPDPDRPRPRIRPEYALQLPKIAEQLQESEVFGVPAEKYSTSKESVGGRWSLLHVLSPYSPDVHLMVMESSPHRYVPTLLSNSLDRQKEVPGVMALCGQAVREIRKANKSRKINLGWHWSPRSWGPLEEVRGFQSIPTKWHAMIWNWPEESHECFAQVPTSSLQADKRWLLNGENEIQYQFCNLIYQTLIKKGVLQGAEPLPGVKFIDGWRVVEDRALVRTMDAPLTRIFLGDAGAAQGGPVFISVVEPLLKAVDGLMAFLSEAFTTMDCEETDKTLSKCAREGLSAEDLASVRSPPEARSREEVMERFNAAQLPTTIVDLFLPGVQLRCRPDGGTENPDDHPVWRKGFGYSVLFQEDVASGTTELRVMPGFRNGPAGCCESMGVSLNRPENYSMPLDLREKLSKQLYSIGDALR